MPYRNFTLLGDGLVEAWARHSPFRANRLITALEDFICGGPATRVAPEVPAAVEVYLAPPRSILGGVSDAGALLLVDRRSQTVEIIEVVSDYFEGTGQDWPELVARARRALENHR